jgi:hypothetical protein
MPLVRARLAVAGELPDKRGDQQPGKFVGNAK